MAEAWAQPETGSTRSQYSLNSAVIEPSRFAGYFGARGAALAHIARAAVSLLRNSLTTRYRWSSKSATRRLSRRQRSLRRALHSGSLGLLIGTALHDWIRLATLHTSWETTGMRCILVVGGNGALDKLADI